MRRISPKFEETTLEHGKAMEYEIRIEGTPVVTPRPRVMKKGYAYTPARAKRAQEKIGQAWRDAYGDTQLQSAVSLQAELSFEPPKSWSNKKKTAALAGEVKATSHAIGDIDNLCKTIMDGLNRVAFEDDSQVVCVSATKIYAERAETRIIVKEE